MKPLYLYIHIPYCHHRCPYCDFATAIEAAVPQEDYALTLMAELDAFSNKPEWKERELRTIYFGGGTPTIFDAKIIRRIIFAVIGRYNAIHPIEVSIEANPNDLDFDKLEGLRNAGITRLSIGAQSFKPETLKALGRTHTEEDITRSIELARKAGFSNISIDLIYGAPEQSFNDFKSDVAKLAQLNLQHASLYSLTIEKGTEFYTRVGKGKLKLPKDDLVADMMDYANEELPRIGMDRYEVSNFARPGFESQHNSAYWDGDDYLGIGMGAHSMLELKDRTRMRWANIANPAEYMNKIRDNIAATAWTEHVQGPELGFEYLMMGLRKTKGISIEGFRDLTGKSIQETYPGMMEVLVGSKFLENKGDYLRLTPRGMAVADSVIQNFVPEKS